MTNVCHASNPSKALRILFFFKIIIIKSCFQGKVNLKTPPAYSNNIKNTNEQQKFVLATADYRNTELLWRNSIN